MSTTEPPTAPNQAGLAAPGPDAADRPLAEFPSATVDQRSDGWGQLPLYSRFYGLAEPPFDLTPNPRFLFLSTHQREALSSLRYALATSKGFTLILGDAGTGKTTLVRTALAELVDRPSRYVLVSNPTLQRAEFYEFLAREFGLSPAAAHSKARFLSDLQPIVEARFAAGGLTGLIVDEAQSMPHELLEEIRLLGNIETTTTKLLNIVLCGQPELADRLNDPSLRQLKQRIALRCELRPLSLDETAAYISGRLRIAGGAPAEIFTRETVIAIYQAAAGIPRTINVLCDNVLLGGFAAQARPIPVGIVSEVCRDFDIGTVLPTDVSPAKKLNGLPAPSLPINDVTDSVTGRGDHERPMFSSVVRAPRRRFSFFS